MSTSHPELDPRATDVRFGPGMLVVQLADGRRLEVPLAWFPRLAEATDEQRSNWMLLDGGEGIHWPDVDEDLSVAGMLTRGHAWGA